MRQILFLFVLLSLFFFQCKIKSHSKKQNKNSEIKKYEIRQSLSFLNAEYSHWQAGIESGGSGIDISIKCFISNPDIIAFDSLVIQSISFPVHITRNTIKSGNPPLVFQTGDTIIIKSGKRENKSIPENLRGLRGNLAGKLYYRTNISPLILEIPQISENPSINRP
jgi:hypothetical protein